MQRFVKIKTLTPTLRVVPRHPVFRFSGGFELGRSRTVLVPGVEGLFDVVTKPVEGAKKEGLWGFATGPEVLNCSLVEKGPPCVSLIGPVVRSWGQG